MKKIYSFKVIYNVESYPKWQEIKFFPKLDFFKNSL